MKNNSNYSNNQQLFVVGTRSKVIDSLDLENFSQQKEIHFDAEIEDQKSPRFQQASNRRSPFPIPSSNG
ncbi:unnamed protein product, partial [Rotaria magnacalcarata]